MAKALRVGIVGATGGWASESHVVAVQKLHGFELAAVASSSQATADAAAKKLGVKAAYGRGIDLINDPEVDLVTVAVRVPDHRDLVMAALAVGKHVYCEWPLGRNVAEAEEMADAARSAGVHTVIGLQTRASPAARRARDALKSGSIGRVLSTRVYSSTAGFGPEVSEPYVYLELPENGANLVTIQGAHTLDLCAALLGPFTSVTALATTQFPWIVAGKEKPLQPRTTFDHLFVQGRMANDVPFSAEVAGGRPADDTPFRLEVTGERGSLMLEGGAARGFQSARLHLRINGVLQSTNEGEGVSMPDAAVNVAGLYASFRDDVASGAETVPNFEHALRLTRLVADLFSSSKNGSRKPAADWP